MLTKSKVTTLTPLGPLSSNAVVLRDTVQRSCYDMIETKGIIITKVNLVHEWCAEYEAIVELETRKAAQLHMPSNGVISYENHTINVKPANNNLPETAFSELQESLRDIFMNSNAFEYAKDTINLYERFMYESTVGFQAATQLIQVSDVNLIPQRLNYLAIHGTEIKINFK